jgi:hypothetical protein
MTEAEARRMGVYTSRWYRALQRGDVRGAHAVVEELRRDGTLFSRDIRDRLAEQYAARTPL